MVGARPARPGLGYPALPKPSPTRPSALSQVCLFLKRGADQHAVDHKKQDPLSIAVQEANADIVTL